VAATFGLLVALLMFILIGFVSPDDGPSASSVQQGLAIAAVIAAVPVAVLFGSSDPSRIVALAGAMTAAGLVTMFGGNFAGLAMAISGAVILFSLAPLKVPRSLGIAGRLVGYAALLIGAMWLSLGETTLLTTAIAMSLALVVAVTGLQSSGTDSTTA
jgi:hypothetical protein